MEHFTGFPPATPLDAILLPNAARSKYTLVQVDADSVNAALERTRASVQALHRKAVEKKTSRARHQCEGKSGARANFHVGGYVLWSKINARLGGNKLMARWLGPLKVTEALQHSFKIEYLVTKDVFEVHESRIKFYVDPSFQVWQEILELAASQTSKIGAEFIADHRRNERTGQWELLIKWRGLESLENS